VKNSRNGEIRKAKQPVAEIVSIKEPALRFKCYQNKPIITGHLRVFLISTIDQKKYNVRIGEKITLGSEEFGTEEYTAVAIQGSGSNTVLILKDSKGTEYKIVVPAQDGEAVEDGAAS
ncbi:MAG: hypothetical protein J6Q65_00085, partial [Lentisphaeria bacterium]|nr:hypothetical protein [Lentisphaeria bacterium]